MPFRKVASNKHCALCGDTGHHQYQCKRIKNDYGRYPLANKDNQARMELAKNLMLYVSLPNAHLFNRDINDRRPIMKEFPKKVKGLVVHQRFLDNSLTGGINNNIICVECTIIKEEYHKSSKVLFESSLVVRHVLKKQSNLIVNLMW